MAAIRTDSHRGMEQALPGQVSSPVLHQEGVPAARGWPVAAAVPASSPLPTSTRGRVHRADRADLAAGLGRPRIPGQRQPGPRASRGPPDLGGLPGRAGGLNRASRAVRCLLGRSFAA